MQMYKASWFYLWVGHWCSLIDGIVGVLSGAHISLGLRYQLMVWVDGSITNRLWYTKDQHQGHGKTWVWGPRWGARRTTW